MIAHAWGAAALTPALPLCLLAFPALAQEVPAAGPGGDILLGLMTAFVRSLAYGCLFIAAGGALFLKTVMRNDLRLARRLQPGLLVLCVVAGCAATLDVGFHGAQAGDGLPALFGASAWVSGLASDRGLGASILLIGLGLLALGIAAHGRPAASAAGMAGVLTSAAALAAGSDAAAEPPEWLSFGAVALHVLAAMALAGAVWPLVVSLTTQPVEDSLRLVRRFARPSITAAAVLGISGLLLSPAGLVDPDTILTSYGIIWYCKLLLAGGLVVVALRQRRMLILALDPGLPASGLPLRRSIFAEGALYATIVLATVLLQLTQTPFFPAE